MYYFFAPFLAVWFVKWRVLCVGSQVRLQFQKMQVQTLVWCISGHIVQKSLPLISSDGFTITLTGGRA